MKIRYNEKLIKDYPRVPFLNPILGSPKDQNPSKIGVYDKNGILMRENEGKNILHYSNIENCDYVIYPKNFKIDFMDELKKESDFCKKYHKKIIVFYDDDNEIPINIGNCIIFRNSLSTDNPKNEYCMPAFIPPLEEYGKKLYNDNVISIGYVGYLKKPFLNTHNKLKSNYYIKNILYKRIINTKIINFIKDSNCIEPLHKRNTLGYIIIQKGTGINIRSKAINSIIKYSRFKKNFIKRAKKLNPNVGGDYRKEYIENIYSNTFSIAIRGDGNFSYRLYEIMSIGGIPLFIDTKCRMPFEEEIDYKKLFVWCPFDDIKNIDEYITKFLKDHENLEIVRKSIKEIYKKYFIYPARCKKICEFLMKKV